MPRPTHVVRLARELFASQWALPLNYTRNLMVIMFACGHDATLRLTTGEAAAGYGIMQHSTRRLIRHGLMTNAILNGARS